MIVVEVAVTASTLALTHVTYWNTYRDTPPDDWPHVRYRRIVGKLARHHGKWLMWQISTVLPRRRVTHREDQS